MEQYKPKKQEEKSLICRGRQERILASDGAPLSSAPTLVDARGTAITQGEVSFVDARERELLSKNTSIEIPPQVLAAQKDQDDLVRAIERGEIGVERVFTYADYIEKKFHEFAKSFGSDSSHVTQILERFSAYTHEHLESSKDRETNPFNEATALKAFKSVDSQKTKQFISFLIQSISGEKVHDMQPSIRQRELSTRLFLHLHNYLKDFDFSQFSDEVIKLFCTTPTQRELLSGILINYYIQYFSQEQAEKLVKYIDNENQEYYDLSQELFRHFPLLAEIYHSHDKSLEKLASMSPKDILANLDTTIALAYHEADPYAEIPTNIGIELEFKLPGKNQESTEILKLFEPYRDILYVNHDNILWQDRDVAEIAFGGQSGIEWSKENIKKLNTIIREIEKHPLFMAWGSTHIHVDTTSQEHTPFMFNNKNGDGKGFETKSIPPRFHATESVLNVQNLIDQVTVLGALYQKDVTVLCENAYGTDGAEEGTKILSIYDFLQDVVREQEFFHGKGFSAQYIGLKVLLEATSKQPKVRSALLRLFEKGAIPYVDQYNIADLFAQKAEPFTLTPEILTAMANLDRRIQQSLIEKAEPFTPTPELLTAMANLNRHIQQSSLVEKAEPFTPTPELLTAMAKLDWYAQRSLIKKAEPFTPTPELLTAIARLDRRIQQSLIEKSEPFTPTPELLTAMINLYWDAQQSLVEKAKRNGDAIQQYILDKNIPLEHRLAIDAVFDTGLFTEITPELLTAMAKLEKSVQNRLAQKSEPFTLTPELLTAIAKLNGNAQYSLVEKADPFVPTPEIVTAMEKLDWDAQYSLVEKSEPFVPTPELLTAMAKLDPRIQQSLIEKAEPFVPTPELLTAMAKLDEFDQDRLAQKAELFTQTPELLTAMAKLNWVARQSLEKKLSHSYQHLNSSQQWKSCMGTHNIPS